MDGSLTSNPARCSSAEPLQGLTFKNVRSELLPVLYASPGPGLTKFVIVCVAYPVREPTTPLSATPGSTSDFVFGLPAIIGKGRSVAYVCADTTTRPASWHGMNSESMAAQIALRCVGQIRGSSPFFCVSMSDLACFAPRRCNLNRIHYAMQVLYEQPPGMSTLCYACRQKASYHHPTAHLVGLCDISVLAL